MTIHINIYFCVKITFTKTSQYNEHLHNKLLIYIQINDYLFKYCNVPKIRYKEVLFST